MKLYMTCIVWCLYYYYSQKTNIIWYIICYPHSLVSFANCPSANCLQRPPVMYWIQTRNVRNNSLKIKNRCKVQWEIKVLLILENWENTPIYINMININCWSLERNTELMEHKYRDAILAKVLHVYWIVP